MQNVINLVITREYIVTYILTCFKNRIINNYNEPCDESFHQIGNMNKYRDTDIKNIEI